MLLSNGIDSEKRESVIMGDMNINYLLENDLEVIKDIFTMVLSKYLIPQRALLIKPPH